MTGSAHNSPSASFLASPVSKESPALRYKEVRLSSRPLRAPHQQNFSPEEWEIIRPIFTELYIHQNLKLQDVRLVLYERFGYVLSRSMCERQIRHWNLRKRFKSHDKERLASTAANYLSMGIESPAQQIDGRTLKLDKLKRHLRKKSHFVLSWKQARQLESLSKFDSYVSFPAQKSRLEVAELQRCMPTPPDSKRCSPNLEIVFKNGNEEKLLMATKGYFDWYFYTLTDSGMTLDEISIFGLPLGRLRTDSTNLLWPGEPISLIEQGIVELSNGDMAHSFSKIRRASDQMKPYLLRHYPTTLLSIVRLLGLATWEIIPELRRELWHFISSMTETLLSRYHPFTMVTSTLFSERTNAPARKIMQRYIVDTLRSSAFSEEQVCVANLLNRVGVLRPDGSFDEDQLQRTLEKNRLPLTTDDPIPLMQDDFSSGTIAAMSPPVENHLVTSIRPKVEGARELTLLPGPCGIESPTTNAKPKSLDDSNSKNGVVKVVRLMRAYVTAWNVFIANGGSSLTKDDETDTNTASPFSTVKSADSPAFSEVSGQISTPQSSVSLPPIGAGSPSDGELSFVNASDDSNIENPVFDRDAAFLQELAQRILRRCLNSGRMTGLITLAGSDSNSRESFPSDISTGSSRTKNGKGRKRALRDSDEQDDIDDEDDHKENARNKRGRNNALGPVKLFACPYWKHNPERYSGSNLVEREKSYRGCSSIYLKDISRLKQHLWRVHRKPDYFCCICFDTFESQNSLFAHMKRRDCHETKDPFQERMSEQQLARIKRRNMKQDPVHQWFDIFRILFPGEPEPISPYADGNSAVDHFAALFRWFGPEEFLNMLRDRRDRGGPPLEMSTRLIALEAFERALPGYLEHRNLLEAPNQEDSSPTEPESSQTQNSPLQPLGLPIIEASAINGGNLTNQTFGSFMDTTFVTEWRDLEPPVLRNSIFDYNDWCQDETLGWADPIDPMEASKCFDVLGFHRGAK